ncbi:hypothetical protein [Nocardia transvalensis]|uniref:hypothetical protein n=1 Tax=Nocardia transvalensis TaxID=37333 RepID=UPI001892EE91|nr:hypothetical protein [Nocardia transvalensis]MBF6329401.1 hypothetical protein [Nocardia transvalensis]
MKRSTLALITVGMILAGAGVVELLGDASSAEVSDPTPRVPPAVANGTPAQSP